MSRFVWDARKEIVNLVKHGVDFSTARKAFLDPHRAGYWRKGRRYYEKEEA